MNLINHTIQFMSSTKFQVNTLPVLKANSTITTQTIFSPIDATSVSVPVLEAGGHLVLETTITSVESQDSVIAGHDTFGNPSEIVKSSAVSCNERKQPTYVLIHEIFDEEHKTHLIPSHLVQEKDHQMLELLSKRTPSYYHGKPGRATLAFQMLMDVSLPHECIMEYEFGDEDYDKDYNQEIMKPREGEWAKEKVNKVDSDHPVVAFYAIDTTY